MTKFELSILRESFLALNQVWIFTSSVLTLDLRTLRSLCF